MAFQFDFEGGKPPGAVSSEARSKVERYEDEKDWNPKEDDVEVSSRELPIAAAMSRFEGRRSDPVTDLKYRLSLWGKSHKYLVFVAHTNIPRSQLS